MEKEYKQEKGHSRREAGVWTGRGAGEAAIGAWVHIASQSDACSFILATCSTKHQSGLVQKSVRETMTVFEKCATGQTRAKVAEKPSGGTGCSSDRSRNDKTACTMGAAYGHHNLIMLA